MVTLPQYFVPNTEDDLSQWPSSEEVGQVEYTLKQALPPANLDTLPWTSADSEFQTVGYIKKLPEGTDLPEVKDSPPETKGNKTPSSAKRKENTGQKTLIACLTRISS